jgi:hypothetical protein
MRGFPMFFATKQDYLNCLELYPEQTKEALKALYADRFTWVKGAQVDSADSGITDKTHRVLPQKNDKGEEEFFQYSLQEDANARVFMLGFTKKEIENLTK